MTTHAFVFARGGSQGLPRKNILPLNGVPLLGHSIRLGQRLANVERVFVSTEDPEIAEVALSFGADVIPRPPELARGDSPEWLAWQHAVGWVSRSHGVFDRFLSIPTTAPLRSDDDVLACLDALTPEWDVVMTMSVSARSPWFNMVVQGEHGQLRLVNEMDKAITRRQDAPLTYDLSTVAYAAWCSYIQGNTSIWHGRVRGIQIPVSRALDIDTEYEYKIARWAMETPPPRD